MSKDIQKKLRESFRPALQVQSIAQLKKQNPNLMYHAVRYDTHLDPDGSRIDKWLDKGWSIVSTKENLEDDRSLAPKSKEDDKLRVKPLTFKGKGNTGAEFVYLSIPKNDFKANQEARMSREMAGFEARQKVKTIGNNVHITGNELNESNPTSNEVD